MADRSPTPADGDPIRVATPEADWPAPAADTIVRVVGQVRDATTGKVEKAARVVVYGVLAGILGAVVAVLLAITLVRLVVVLLPDAWFGESHVWAAHLLVGLLFTVGGALVYKQRHPKPEDA